MLSILLQDKETLISKLIRAEIIFYNETGISCLKFDCSTFFLIC